MGILQLINKCEPDIETGKNDNYKYLRYSYSQLNKIDLAENGMRKCYYVFYGYGDTPRYSHTSFAYYDFFSFISSFDPVECANWGKEDIQNYHCLRNEFINAYQSYNKRKDFYAMPTTPPKGNSVAGAMVKGAVVGKLIGGDGGAVVGAMVAKERHNAKK